jgi:hypothetical protein
MPDTFTKIATVTVGAGGAASIDFSSIPSTYTDLCVKVSVRKTDSGNENMGIRFNATGGTGYSHRKLQGTGSTANSGTGSGTASVYMEDFIEGTDSTTNTFANGEFYIPNYASSNYKSVSADGVTENNATAARATLTAGLWSNTTAINQITLLPLGGGTFAQYSTATLYGINNA